VARFFILTVLGSALVGVILGLAFVGSEYYALASASGETARTTQRFNPPVWAGQIVPGACTGGFYARQGNTIVLTIVGHCSTPGATLRDGSGQMIGVFGPLAQLSDCPPGRFCSPSDFLAMALAPDRIPWGHLNLVDFGAGGYRTIAAGIKPLACGDISVGARVEVDGREHYRAGQVIASEDYKFATDTIFPCMIISNILAVTGDSGGAVLINGAPAGITSRNIGGYLAFTPLAEGLDNLGLTLCTTPDCGLTPATAVQP